MSEELEKYLDDKFNELIDGLLKVIKPQVKDYAAKIVEVRGGTEIEQLDLDLALVQLGLAINLQLEEGKKDAEISNIS